MLCYAMASHINEFLLQHTSTEDASSPENSMLGPGMGCFVPMPEKESGEFLHLCGAEV